MCAVLGRDPQQGARPLPAAVGYWAGGGVTLRRPLSGLDSVRAAPGLVATVSVLFGSTAFDGAAASTAWADRARSGPLGPATANTVGLAVTVVLVSLAVTAALKPAGRVAGTPAGTAGPAALFAHSLGGLLLLFAS